MKKNILLCLGVCLILSSCISTYTSTVCEMHLAPHTAFNFAMLVRSEEIGLCIRIVRKSWGWIAIKEGESLRILADGENISLHTVTSVYSELRTEDNRTYCYETVCYGITTEQVEAIIYAQDVSLRLCGYQFYDNFTLTRSNIEYIKESYNLYKNIGLIE